MKIIAYAIRDDELPYVKQWSQENNIEVKVVQDLLTMDNVDLCKGCDGLVSYQQKPYTTALINRMHEDGIKYWSLRNVGIDNIDLDAVKQNGMILTNVPAYSPDSVGEFSVLSALRLIRQSKAYERKMRAGNFMWAPNIGKELHEMTVGIIGTGHIGGSALKYFQGFGCKIVAYNLHQYPEYQGLYVDTLDELYAQADIIDLHSPLTLQTKHMINDDAISKMKDGVYIINTARGEVVDTDALIRGLDNGKIAGAALDTYESEVGIFNNTFKDFDAIPDARLKNLMQRDNVLITPHIGFYTETAVRNMVYSGLTNNKQLIESNGQKADSIVKL
ncbi:MAG: D-2-hydroxyacid dehydrogenase [Candidatus Paralactobacillus gallistercoris]|uniref:D-2-hydroxyacid dehydrogenase n=1 Tax=Candidatus Paralactobacillus gallistercoris TaxID=2838724 RepID=A0A948X2D3_9LACO|nr:D-2-hydroxyacid dehydrogenase [Candidatus Paralactobacillus gallistercoris]